MPTHGDMNVDWDKDALRAASAPYPYTSGDFLQYFKEFVPPNAEILEVGCQIASWYPAWRELEPTVRYEGLDFSPVAIKIARERYPERKFYLMNAKEMDFDQEFDIVFTHTFFQPTNIETKRIVAPRIWRALKRGGLLIIQENTSYESAGTFFKDGWIKFFAAYGFELLRTHDIGGGGTGFVFKKGPKMLNPGTPEHNWEAYYNLKQGDIYVEAGAFWCRYGRIASKRVGPKGRVVLIEPSPINIAVIEKVVETEGLSNVTLVRRAVWRERGRMKFCCMGNPAGHRLWGSPSDRDVIEVEVDTVDNILDLGVDHVDLFAADVEGAEVEMVKGMDRWLSEKKILHVAIAAYHRPGNPEAIMETLKQRGCRDIKYAGGVVYGHA